MSDHVDQFSQLVGQINYHLESGAVMSAGRAKPGSRPGTDRLFPVSDRVQVAIHVI